MLFGKQSVPVKTDERKIEELLTRGVENVIPRELAQKKLRSGERLRVYLGIDPTGAQLHLGHSVPLRKLKAFADLGHHVIFVVGSFTAMIGDPSGRDAAREPLTKRVVEENFKDYRRQAEKVLDFSNVEVRYNHEWLEALSLSDVVKLASHFTVQQFLQRDMFQKRISEGKPIALHEFLYPLMVGYDSVVLDVDGELGGSDQEFNILAGRQLQSALGKRDKFVLTTRLIEGTDGRKMSKAYGNSIYLEDDPGTMYGKVMSIRDELVPTYFEACTDVSSEKIGEIVSLHPRDAKLALAHEIVRMYHGGTKADKAKENFINVFSKGETPRDPIEIRVSENISVTDRLVSAKVVSSKSDLRRLIAEGAVRLLPSEEKISDIDSVPAGSVLRIGKHRFVKIKNRP